MRRSAIIGLAAFLLASSSCSSSPSTRASTPRATQGSASPTISGTPAQAVARLASGAALPSECTPKRPKRSDTTVFVSAGHAWALSADGTTLTCLFDVQDPGPFIWGPLGDRALIGGFEVKGLPGALTLPPSDLQAGPASWGRPTGKSIVLVSADAADLEKVHLDGEPQEDITPLSKARYLSLTYHPSGLAIAFAVERGGSQSIWVSSNTGDKPRRLVFSKEGTKFGALAFGADGDRLYYEARHANGLSVLHQIFLTDPTQVLALWSAPVGRRVLDIWPSPEPERATTAWTVGSSCADSRAMLQGSDRAMPALPSEPRPTHMVGWLDAERVLVAAGGCSAPLDLSAVNVNTGSAQPLVFGVDAAGVRTPAPTPPPPLPTTDADVGSGNA